MKLDITIGQIVRYRGYEGQVVAVEGGEVGISLTGGGRGGYLWVREEDLVDYNPNIPLLEEDPIVDPFEEEDDDLYESCGIF